MIKKHDGSLPDTMQCVYISYGTSKLTNNDIITTRNHKKSYSDDRILRAMLGKAGLDWIRSFHCHSLLNQLPVRTT